MSSGFKQVNGPDGTPVLTSFKYGPLSRLRWGPAEVQPLVVSPNSWMWNPCSPGFRLVISPVIRTGSEPVGIC